MAEFFVESCIIFRSNSCVTCS